MLQDYEIGKVQNRSGGKWFAVLEFILILFMIQSVLMLLNHEQPEEAVRVRILAHSNAPSDQRVKEEIREAVEPLIKAAYAESGLDISEFHARMEELDAEIERIAEEKAPGMGVKFDRKAELFPPKRSGFYITPQAPYEAYVLTIGSGRGDNWWCALFPNVCFPDKKAEEPKEEEKVTFFLWEWIKGIFA